MSFIVVGTNHKYSPIDLRERIYFSKKGLREALVSLPGSRGISAAVILSTCNRVELYAGALEPEAGLKALKEFLARYHRQELEDIGPYLYTYTGKEAILHLFRVACGLDSQIIGESQILEQMRFSWELAKRAEATDRFLDTLFAQAEKTALKVRQETGISKGDISIASIALEQIKTKCGCIKDKKILIIGVGKISQLVIRRLKDERAQAVFIANKTFAKARQLAARINAEVVRFDRLKEKLQEADIVISATASPHLILKKEDLLEIKKPLLIIDLALPRDVDREAKKIKGIELLCLDDLNPSIENNLNLRRQGIPAALEIIKKEVNDLCSKEPLESVAGAARLP